jgi:pSer/pThr/pTyr-binding forkhead associated (FHA) protein
VDGLAIALVALLFLILGGAVWFLVTRRGPAEAAPVTRTVTAPGFPPSDDTEVMGAGARGGDQDATMVRQAEAATVVRGATKQRTRAHLMITRRGEESQVNLEKPEEIVGRDDNVSIPINDPLASRQHAKIVREGDQYWIEDLRSLNGTLVNGETVTRRQLVSNDHIGIGETVLTFVVEPQ